MERAPRRNPTTITPIRVTGLLLALLLGIGAFAEPSAEFDWTLGIDVYASAGVAALGVGIAVLAVLLASDTVADAVGHIGAAVRRVTPTKLRVPLLVAAATALYLALTDLTLSGDGAGVIYVTERGVLHASNALTSGIHVGVTALFGIDARDALRLVSCASGAVYVVGAVALAREAFDETPPRAAMTALLLTAGPGLLFFGSLEVYAPFAAALVVYLWLALRALNERSHPAWAAAVLGVLLGLHGMAVALAPSLLLLLRKRGGARCVIASLLALALTLLPIAAFLYVGVWGAELPRGDAERFGNALGAAGQGPFLPLVLTPTNVTHRYALIDAEHLLGVLSIVLLASPAGLLLALLGRQRDGRAPFLLAAVAGLVALALVWNVSYSLRQDRDLFAALGIPLAALAALRALDPAMTARGAVRIAAVTLFAFVPTVLGNASGAAQQRAYATDVAQAYDVTAEWFKTESDASRAHDLQITAARWRRSAAEAPGASVDALVDEATLGADLSRSRELLQQALTREPNHPRASALLGEALLRLERFEEARAELLRSLTLGHEAYRARSRKFLAMIALREKRVESAVHHLERGLREEVASPDEAVEMLRMLATIRREQGQSQIARTLEVMALRRARSGSKQAGDDRPSSGDTRN